jgi:queuine tRNA-ribosyltransferase
LRHLFVAGEMLAARLASLHSLTFYLKMMRDMRASIIAGRFGEWRSEFLSRYEEGGGSGGESDRTTEG